MKQLVCIETPSIRVIAPDDMIIEVGSNCWQVKGSQPLTYAKSLWRLEECSYSEIQKQIDLMKDDEYLSDFQRGVITGLRESISILDGKLPVKDSVILNDAESVRATLSINEVMEKVEREVRSHHGTHKLNGSSEKLNNHEGLDEAARKYLMEEHRSPLTAIMHEADLNAELQYHKDIENAFKAGAKWAMEQGVKGEVKDFCFVREVNYASAKIEFDTIPELKEGEKVIVQIRKQQNTDKDE